MGCGWLGLPLAKHLVSKGHVIKGSTTSESKISNLKRNGVEPFLIDLRAVQSTAEISKFLASEFLVIAIPPRVKHHNNFKEQIESLISFIEKSTIKKVIFISSTSVYPNTNNLVTEEDISIPESDSGIVLLEVERLLQSNKFFQTTILRMAGLYGYDRQPGRFLAGKKELVNADGKVNLIHQDDCIQIINNVLEKQLWNEVYNCCSDEHPTRQEFYTKAALTLGMEPPEFLPKEKSVFKIISNQKLKAALNYEFIHPDPMA
ncbi:MAG: nucleoside-diphosphate-sugar epimerase, partial [Cyclobacteriaceae bacterium]